MPIELGNNYNCLQGVKISKKIVHIAFNCLWFLQVEYSWEKVEENCPPFFSYKILASSSTFFLIDEKVFRKNARIALTTYGFSKFVIEKVDNFFPLFNSNAYF